MQASPLGITYLHQGLGLLLVLQSRARTGPIQLPMQRHVAPFGILCGHWTICMGLVAVTGGLGQIPACTEQLDTR